MTERAPQRAPWLFAAVILLRFSVAAASDSDLRIAELGECRLESGDAIEDCRVGYRALGTLAPDRSNVMLVPTWYTGTSGHLVEFGYVGQGAIADTSRFHVIVADAFGNGVSSSPSNSPRQPLDRFPRFTVRDMVDAHHRLLTEVLGFDHVRVVLGVSMGGMQAFEWMVRHPDFMDEAVAIEGTPWLTSFDLLLWTAWIDAAESWDGSEVSLARSSGLLAKLDALTLWTPGHFVPMVTADGFDAFMSGFAAALTPGGLLDRKYQTWAALEHDIRKPFPGFAQRAGDLVRARVLSIVFAQDHMVNPGPSGELAGLIGAESRVLDTPCGHMGPATECVQEEVAALVSDFLADRRD